VNSAASAKATMHEGNALARVRCNELFYERAVKRKTILTTLNIENFTAYSARRLQQLYTNSLTKNAVNLRSRTTGFNSATNAQIPTVSTSHLTCIPRQQIGAVQMKHRRIFTKSL
jgi:hypothetical protein